MKNKAKKATYLVIFALRRFRSAVSLGVAIGCLFVLMLIFTSYNVVMAVEGNAQVSPFLTRQDCASQNIILIKASLSDSFDNCDIEDNLCESEEESEVECEFVPEIIVADLNICHVFLSDFANILADNCKNKFTSIRKSIILQV